MSEINSQFRRILVVDDDPNNLKMAKSVLSHEGYKVQCAHNGEEALARIRRNPPHLVLLDVNMPGINGIETMIQLRGKVDYVSVIFVSGCSEIEDVVHGLDSGADDYLIKPYDPRELLARVRAQLRIKDVRDELKVANDRLKELVDIDDLTGLYNMRSIYSKIEHELKRAQRFRRSMAVVMLDMDHFKSVNDDHDHLFGSFVLKEIGNIIKQNLRQIDFAARYGGDEFLIVLTEVDENGVRVFCERLRLAIAGHTFVQEEDSIQLTPSMGAALTHSQCGELDAQGLVRTADNALYRSKEAGRNCVHLYKYSSGRTSLLKKDKK